MSDTPISDSTAHTVADLGMLCRRLERLAAVRLDYIKQLETENDAMRADLLFDTYPQTIVRELNRMADRIKRLEEAGDAVAAIIGPPGSAHWADENQVDAAWNNWTKAKEAK